MGHAEIIADSDTIETGLALWVKVGMLIVLIIPVGILWFSIYYINKIPNTPPLLATFVSVAGIPIALYIAYKILASVFTKLRIDDGGIHILENYVWYHCAWNDFSIDNLKFSEYGVAIRLQKQANARRLLFFKISGSYTDALLLFIFPVSIQHAIIRVIHNRLPEKNEVKDEDEVSISIGEWPFSKRISLDDSGLCFKQFFTRRCHDWDDIKSVTINYPSLKHIQSLGVLIELKNGHKIGAYSAGWYANPKNSTFTAVLKKYVSPDIVQEFAVHIIMDLDSANMQMLEVEDAAKSIEKSVRAAFVFAYILGALSLAIIHYFIYPFTDEELKRYVLAVIGLPLVIIVQVMPFYIFYKYIEIPVLKNIIKSYSIRHFVQ